MKLRLILSPEAAKYLRRIERSIFSRIDRALLLLRDNQYPAGAKTIQDKRLAEFRIRVGDYRILYDVYPDDGVIYVIRIGHRKDIYR